jgi:hypothetical protein
MADKMIIALRKNNIADAMFIIVLYQLLVKSFSGMQALP